MSDLWFGIKLTSQEVPAKAFMLIKKATGVPPTVVKKSIQDDECFYVCDFGNTDGLSAINYLNEGLHAIGLETKLYEHGVERDEAFFSSIERLHREIEEEVEAYPD